MYKVNKEKLIFQIHNCINSLPRIFFPGYESELSSFFFKPQPKNLSLVASTKSLPLLVCKHFLKAEH